MAIRQRRAWRCGEEGILYGIASSAFVQLHVLTMLHVKCLHRCKVLTVNCDAAQFQFANTSIEYSVPNNYNGCSQYQQRIVSQLRQLLGPGPISQPGSNTILVSGRHVGMLPVTNNQIAIGCADMGSSLSYANRCPTASLHSSQAVISQLLGGEGGSEECQLGGLTMPRNHLQSVSDRHSGCMYAGRFSMSRMTPAWSAWQTKLEVRLRQQ